MLVKWTKSVPGGEKRGFVEGREFDWPMQIISKLRADYGQDCLIMVGTLADRNARQQSRNERREGPKPSRQERLGMAPIFERQEMQEDRPRRRGRPRRIQETEAAPSAGDSSEPIPDELTATA